MKINFKFKLLLFFVLASELLNGEPVLMDFSLWIATVTSICAAIVFAMIGALSAIVNTTMTPVEPIAGRLGLFIWNCLSCMHHYTTFRIIKLNAFSFSRLCFDCNHNLDSTVLQEAQI